MSNSLRRIVETDNYGGDYPDEKFVGPALMEVEHCQAVCDIFNQYTDYRFYKVVPIDYQLSPGFEP